MRNSLTTVTSRSLSLGATCAAILRNPGEDAGADRLVRIAALSAIEADIRGLSADKRRQARQRCNKPLIDDLRLLEAQPAAISGKATIAEAIRYTLSRWDALTRRVLPFAYVPAADKAAA
jgi:hypothetical protein